ncbi:MAG: hypothetical protein LQ348_006902 [Seirophora lacunosa]|nr:MAG: hypothetical protein LQ348_006902 [Seirophora lacunosa]
MFSNATLAQALLTVYDYSAYALRGQKVSTNLIRKPDTLWTACLKLVRILVSPFEKKYETIDGPPSRAVNGILQDPIQSRKSPSIAFDLQPPLVPKVHG